MKQKTAKRWFNWHKWTSLICTIFLLYLCITGLPLIFHEEIEHQLEENKEAVVTQQKLNLDKLAEIIAYPGTPFTSKHPYAVFMRGNTALTSKLLRPVLIDAKTGLITDSSEMSWYVNTLFLSEPLHFVNYGGGNS